MGIIKKLQTINTGEGVVKRKPFYTGGGNLNWYSYYREQRWDSLKTKNDPATIWPYNLIPGHISGENNNMIQC